MHSLPLKKHWNHYLDPAVVDVIDFLHAKGCELILVGGAVRDFLLHGQFPIDMDFEIRNSAIQHKNWQLYLRTIFTDLKATTEELAFCVFRVKLSSQNIEFASGRLETYPAKADQAYGHSEFSTELLSYMEFSKSVQRRDFTINAIGLKLLIDGGSELLDPLAGVEHLKLGELHPCSDSFTSDPVRLLRLIRFKILYNCKSKIDTSLFKLEKLTAYYLRYESAKCNFSQFMHAFLQEAIPPWAIKLKFIERLSSDKAKEFNTAMEFIKFAILQGENISVDEILYFAKIFNIKKSKIDELRALRKLIALNFSFDDWLSKMKTYNNISMFAESREIIEELLPFVQFFKKYPMPIRDSSIPEYFNSIHALIFINNKLLAMDGMALQRFKEGVSKMHPSFRAPYKIFCYLIYQKLI